MGFGGRSSSNTTQTTTNVSDQSVRIGDIGFTGSDAVELTRTLTDASLRAGALSLQGWSNSATYVPPNQIFSQPKTATMQADAVDTGGVTSAPKPAYAGTDKTTVLVGLVVIGVLAFVALRR